MHRVIMAPEPYYPLREFLKRMFTRERWQERKLMEAVNGNS